MALCCTASIALPFCRPPAGQQRVNGLRGISRARAIVACRAQHQGSAQPLRPVQAGESEEERLRKDAESMMQMEATAALLSGTSSQPGAWKWAIRQRIWKLLEEKGQAGKPKPIDHRIPNFLGSEVAAARLAEQDFFASCKVVKVNPDTPQKMVRQAVLRAGRTLVTPQPRLRTGFFSTLHRDHLPVEDIPFASTSAGVRKHGRPVLLDDPMTVDLVMVGSVAVNPANGCRIGKGEGFAELEYGILRWMGAIDDSTLVVTTVHDLQLVDDISEDMMLEHDVPVDIIVTPTQVIRTGTTRSKPPGILWHKLSPQKLGQIRVLRELKQRIEAETGAPLPSGPDEVLPPIAARKSKGRGGRGRRGSRSD